ncbi:MAG: hypothetical protein ACPGWR_22450 [Ardenticatenaceae bacterium]
MMRAEGRGPFLESIPSLEPYLVGGARMEERGEGVRFILDGASAGEYSDSQLDDFHGRERKGFVWRPPATLAVRARFSHGQGVLRGTAGFGWWNAPFVGDQAINATVGPQVLWFFFGSPPSNLAAAPGWSGNGWFAQGLNVPTWPNWFTKLGMFALRLPLLNRLAHRAAEGATRASEQPLHHLDITQWHDYRIEWRKKEANFWVDDTHILRTHSPPQGPLALVLWIDNQWATLQGNGGLLDIPQPQWMELNFSS